MGRFLQRIRMNQHRTDNLPAAPALLLRPGGTHAPRPSRGARTGASRALDTDESAAGRGAVRHGFAPTGGVQR